MNGGQIIAEVLERQGVRLLFTLCGGHISPILVAAKARSIRVIDTRHEATAVFAADAVARLTGVPGVAAVTAGPGVTNTITAVKNAQLAQSPVILLGGATATLLKGRGSLQDIDQLALFAPHVKAATTVTRVRDLAPALERAFELAQDGVPGPVFLECPVDLLYDESTVRTMFGAKSALQTKKRIPEIALSLYLEYYLRKTFAGAARSRVGPRHVPKVRAPFTSALTRTAKLLRSARRPVLLIGSQAMLRGPDQAARLAEAVQRLGVPTFLGGMARGLLGSANPVWFRHQRSHALREADLVVLAGVPCDFRLNYGLQISRGANLVAVNRDETDLRKNRRPDVAVLADPAEFVGRLSRTADANPSAWRPFLDRLRTRERERDREIAAQTAAQIDGVNPLRVCAGIDRALAEDNVIVADGGDFVATASYIVAPRGPLTWLDPGPFGTLGVGAGFALGAKLCRPNAEVWIVYGDGSVGYSLAEFDTFVRHRVPVIAVVGNDAGWTQIARDQIELLGDDVATQLARTDYDRVAEALGASGLRLAADEQIDAVLAEAKQRAARGTPVLVNAHIGRTQFRKGSISM